MQKEKDHRVRARMVAVRMVRVFNMSVEETASLQVRAPRGSANGYAVMTKEASKASGIFPNADDPEEFRKTSWMV